MSNVRRLAGDSSQDMNIKAAESAHEQPKVTITLSPLTEFIVQGALDMRTRAAAVRQLLDLAALDLLEAKGYTLDSDEFREKYYKWLTRESFTDIDDRTGEQVEVWPIVRL